jgi:L-lactate dehydrogenase complex protein LldG
MREATPKERMLKQIRKALIEKTDNPYPRLEESGPIFKQSDELLEIQFAQEFSKINGQFLFCENTEQCIEDLTQLIEERKWTNIYCWEKSLKEILVNTINDLKTDELEFEQANVGITTCDALVARTGSIIITNASEAGRRLSIYPHIHVVIAYTSQLCADIGDALDILQKRYPQKLPSMISTTTGPSRTADIEKTLVLGAHGPREIFVILIDDQTSHG